MESKRTVENAIILGAGGAARAVAFSLAERGVSITIIARDADKAKELATELSNTFHVSVSYSTFDVLNSLVL